MVTTVWTRVPTLGQILIGSVTLRFPQPITSRQAGARIKRDCKTGHVIGGANSSPSFHQGICTPPILLLLKNICFSFAKDTQKTGDDYRVVCITPFTLFQPGWCHGNVGWTQGPAPTSMDSASCTSKGATPLQPFLLFFLLYLAILRNCHNCCVASSRVLFSCRDMSNPSPSSERKELALIHWRTRTLIIIKV